MTDSTTTSDSKSAAVDFSALGTESEKVQLQLLHKLAIPSDASERILMEFLLSRRSQRASAADGKAYQILYNSDSAAAREFLQTYFPTGLVPLNSELSIDYSFLQRLLAAQDFQAADAVTLQKLCELAGPQAVQRKWLYFTQVENFPKTDLQTINNLWLIHSENSFGFSIQREMWLAMDKNWEKFWPKIGWKNGNNWTRYPDGFTWSLSAPRGHLPLSNQLRGVRVMASLLSHPAWK